MRKTIKKGIPLVDKVIHSPTMRSMNDRPLIISHKVSESTKTSPIIKPKRDVTMTSLPARVIENPVTVIENHSPMRRASRRAIGKKISLQISIMNVVAPNTFVRINLLAKFNFQCRANIRKRSNANTTFRSRLNAAKKSNASFYPNQSFPKRNQQSIYSRN